MEDREHVKQGTAKRAVGIKRKNDIVQAALKIIARDGLRQVRHRSVAKEAGVPVSSTTYYFQTIEDLILATFTYYEEKNAEKLDKAFEKSAAVLLGIDQKKISKEGVHHEVITLFSDILAMHIYGQAEDAENRQVEYAFKNEALRNQELAKKMFLRRQDFLKRLEKLLIFFEVKHPFEIAQQVLALVFYCEYELVLRASIDEDRSIIKKVIHASVKNILTGNR